MGTDFRIGHGYDVHAIAPGLRMVLCGVEIEGDAGFVAHSDGDVAIHALFDALLGALALGDIGKHFPDSSREYAGIDSRILLGRVMELVRGEGWRIVDIDTVLMIQEPKMAPHREQMRANIAAALQIPVENVGVKATTTEWLGYEGRGEGVTAQAVALLEK